MATLKKALVQAPDAIDPALSTKNHTRAPVTTALRMASEIRSLGMPVIDLAFLSSGELRHSRLVEPELSRRRRRRRNPLAM